MYVGMARLVEQPLEVAYNWLNGLLLKHETKTWD